MRYLKYFFGFLFVLSLFVIVFEFNYIGNSKEQISTDVSANDASVASNTTQIDPKQLLIDLKVYEHWYSTLELDYRSDKKFDYTLKAVAQDGDVYLYKLNSLGTPSIYIRPYASLFAGMMHKDCFKDLQATNVKSLDPGNWGVESNDVELVSFKTDIYVLPGAKVPYDLLWTEPLKLDRIGVKTYSSHYGL